MSVNLHLLFPGSSSPSFIVIKKVGRRIKSHIIIQVHIFWCGKPVPVGRFLMIEKTEGLVRITFILKPVQSLFSYYLSAISFNPYSFSIYKKVRIVVLTLAGQHHREIETLRQSVEMYLTDHGSLITICLKQFGEIVLIPVKGLDIVNLPVDKAVLSCKHYCPAWSRY